MIDQCLNLEKIIKMLRDKFGFVPDNIDMLNAQLFCRILKISTEELQHRYDIELPESVKQLLTYALHFVEFCSFQTLNVMCRTPDYLSDPNFRRLMFDMMLAWEAPSVECESDNKVRESIVIAYAICRI